MVLFSDGEVEVELLKDCLTLEGCPDAVELAQKRFNSKYLRSVIQHDRTIQQNNGKKPSSQRTNSYFESTRMHVIRLL